MKKIEQYSYVQKRYKKDSNHCIVFCKYEKTYTVVHNHIKKYNIIKKYENSKKK